jgi:hypothetical protein
MPRLLGLARPTQQAYKMSKVVPFPGYAGSSELIAKLINAGYLRPTQRHDADAITRAIAQMKEDLRGGGGGESGPAVA